MFQMRQEFKECDPNPPSVESRYIYVGYIKQEKIWSEGDKERVPKKKNKGVHPFLKYPPWIKPEDQHLCFSLISFQTEHQ